MAEKKKPNEQPPAIARSAEQAVPDEVMELVAQHPEFAQALEQAPPELRHTLITSFTSVLMEVRHKPKLPVIPADDIIEYNKVIKGAGNDIFKATLDSILVVHEQRRALIAVEQARFDYATKVSLAQQQHDHAIALRQEDRKDRGLLLGFAFGLILVAACIVLAWFKQPFWSILSLASLGIALIGVGGYVAKNRPPEQDTPLPDPLKMLPDDKPQGEKK